MNIDFTLGIMKQSNAISESISNEIIDKINAPNAEVFDTMMSDPIL